MLNERNNNTIPILKIVFLIKLLLNTFAIIIQPVCAENVKNCKIVLVLVLGIGEHSNLSTHTTFFHGFKKKSGICIIPHTLLSLDNQ